MPDPKQDREDEQRASFESALRNVLLALRPYLADIVLIAGWVPYLYRRHGSFDRWDATLSFTIELEVLLKNRHLPPGDRPPIAQLLEEAGLRPERNDGTDSAVWTAPSAHGETVEFLVPLAGPLTRRNAPVSIGGQPGIAAISLPDLSGLERHTIMLRVPLDTGRAETGDVLDVRVPRLGAYVLNKAVTFGKRIPRAGEAVNPKRAKDLLYLRDLMAAGSVIVQGAGDRG